MDVAQIVFDDFTDIDVFLAWDLFHRVRRPDRRVRLLGTAPRHRSAAGLEIEMHGSIDEAREADVVIFASGPATRTLVHDAAYLARFQLDETRQWIGAMCSGALLLAGLGLLRGRRATTYPTTVTLLREMGVEVVEQPFVAEGHIATGAACLAGVDLAGWAIEKMHGPAARRDALAEVQPVGRPSPTEATAVALPAQRRAALDALQMLPGRVAELMHAIGPERWTSRPTPEAFSPREQVHHLHDVDADGYALRVARLLGDDVPELDGIEGAKLAIARNYLQRDHTPALVAFAERRARLVTRLAGVSDETWAREGWLGGSLGSTSLEKLIAAWRAHDDEHLEALRTIASV